MRRPRRNASVAVFGAFDAEAAGSRRRAWRFCLTNPTFRNVELPYGFEALSLRLVGGRGGRGARGVRPTTATESVKPSPAKSPGPRSRTIPRAPAGIRLTSLFD